MRYLHIECHQRNILPGGHQGDNSMNATNAHPEGLKIAGSRGSGRSATLQMRGGIYESVAHDLCVMFCKQSLL
jgi:hypothetical protein